MSDSKQKQTKINTKFERPTETNSKETRTHTQIHKEEDTYTHAHTEAQTHAHTKRKAHTRTHSQAQTYTQTKRPTWDAQTDTQTDTRTHTHTHSRRSHRCRGHLSNPHVSKNVQPHVVTWASVRSAALFTVDEIDDKVSVNSADALQQVSTSVSTLSFNYKTSRTYFLQSS